MQNNYNMKFNREIHANTFDERNPKFHHANQS